MKLELDCKQMSRLLSDRLEGKVPADDLARMRLHLVICEACRDVDEQMQFLRRAMQMLDRHDPPKH
jgi:predicted anti-sigma-YlaC factor YlaD